MSYRDKNKQKEYAHKHYVNNKSKMLSKSRANNKIAIKRNVQYIKDYLETHPCVDCGNSNTIVLEFDHVSGNKKMNLSCMKYGAYSLKALKEEVAKCEVRCANCHRIATYERRVGSQGIEP